MHQKLLRHKLGLLQLATELGNISQACKLMGYSRDTFYRYKEILESEGEIGLKDKSRRVPNLCNRIKEEMEEKILEFSFEFPTYGKDRIANELRVRGYIVSGSTVRNVWIRRKLKNLNDRLLEIERKSREEGYVLNDDQLRALHLKAQDEEAHGEIETHHPGYLGSQDTFYIGHFKGVGRIYQQTFVDTYSRVAICKLYTNKTAITSADLLNDKVLPFFEEKEVPLLRILTDRGSEYCGRIQEHPYQLFLNVNEIEHTKTKAYHPQTNGICERFHRTILNEFYKITFRKKLYNTLTELQTDLDNWLEHYNYKRTHQGKMCQGRTPMQTFLDGKEEWRQKRDEMNLT